MFCYLYAIGCVYLGRRDRLKVYYFVSNKIESCGLSACDVECRLCEAMLSGRSQRLQDS